MASKKRRDDERAKKPAVEGIGREFTPESEQQEQPHPSEVDKSVSHRSGRSVERGGQNDERGEPPPGYGTEAPQVQGGGKR
jgi:hypothetical protein